MESREFRLGDLGSHPRREPWPARSLLAAQWPGRLPPMPYDSVPRRCILLVVLRLFTLFFIASRLRTWEGFS